MWRTNGAGELYTYLPPDYAENEAVCDIPPFSTCNDVYGVDTTTGYKSRWANVPWGEQTLPWMEHVMVRTPSP